MAITIPSLKQATDQYPDTIPYVYQDLHLDFEVASVYSPVQQNKIIGNDIKVDYNEDAIKNSLINMFNTRPGERFLFPDYGLNLNGYIFEKISSFNAQIMENNIKRAIENYETRVQVLKISVTPYPDDYYYDVVIALFLPIFNTTTNINTQLDVKTQTFKPVNKYRNIL